MQVSRLGNPLINEVVIPTGLKDLWNRTSPTRTRSSSKYYKTPILAAVLNKLYKLGVPKTNRDDLVAGARCTGIPKVTFTGTPRRTSSGSTWPSRSRRGEPVADGRARRRQPRAGRTAAG